jgi:hypothetical protein
LTLLDCARYFHKAAGINGLAQIVKDIGEKADPRKLASVAVTLAKPASLFIESSHSGRLAFCISGFLLTEADCGATGHSSVGREGLSGMAEDRSVTSTGSSGCYQGV